MQNKIKSPPKSFLAPLNPLYDIELYEIATQNVVRDNEKLKIGLVHWIQKMVRGAVFGALLCAAYALIDGKSTIDETVLQEFIIWFSAADVLIFIIRFAINEIRKLH